jgi:hypothetical protein
MGKTLFLALNKQCMISYTNFISYKEFDEMIDIMTKQKLIYVAWNFHIHKSLLYDMNN